MRRSLLHGQRCLQNNLGYTLFLAPHLLDCSTEALGWPPYLPLELCSDPAAVTGCPEGAGVRVGGSRPGRAGRRRASCGRRHFRWAFTGHPGAGSQHWTERGML